MINVYWSPWQNNLQTLEERMLSYKEPRWLVEEMEPSINHQNVVDNFFKCPAFVNQAKNTLVLHNTSDVHMKIENFNIVNQNKDPRNNSDVLFKVKSPSLKNSYTINYSCNWIFFADKPLHITTSVPYMHKTVHSDYGYYVPGTYDISKWFRPVEFAFQLWPGETEFRSVENEPLIYVKFNTDEKVKLHQFNTTNEIEAYSRACIHMKRFSKIKALNSLYEVFLGKKYNEQLLKLIKKNVV